MNDVQLPATAPAAISPQRRALTGASLAHLLHDGFTDCLYAFLPLWQSTFSLSYAGLALLRVLYFGTMGALQIPATKLTAHHSPRTVLTAATLIASLGFFLIALPIPATLPNHLALIPLSLGLLIAGIGSSVQHPRASLLVTVAYGNAAKGGIL